MKTKRPKPIDVSQCATIRMVAGNEKRFSKIIHEGAVKQWVGIGWVTERHAEATDYLKIPEAK